MAITFPSKTVKKTSLLVDALRIIAWEEFRTVNKDDLKDLEYGGYQVFADEWKNEEVHKYSYAELEDFVKALEYTIPEVLNYRSEYYAKKKANPKSTSTVKFENTYANEEAAF